MKNSPSLKQVGTSLAALLNRYHVILFSLTVVIGVSVALFMLNSLVNLSNTAEETPPTAIIFDEKIISQIENFNTAESATGSFSLPPGRINPLVE
ncbi:hypothetical protein B7Y94_04095 [Candidatus Saccharibacteria bacterium 32-49-12]|nr:MAG: hypothetical protein B7Y94_04095 [Candidatus Saccharibacteria bacterium 32-49-12]